MKRIIVLILCAIMLLGCVGCSEGGSSAAGSGQGKGGFKVGFSRYNITPEVSVGLEGYGNVSDRMSDNVLSPLYLTCLAISDAKGNTVLLYGMDGTTSNLDVTNTVRNAVTEATGVPASNIMISVTHTHSSPETQNPIFQASVLKGAVKTAKKALAEQHETTMEIGTVETEGLAFIRHYVQENGNIVGDNFGDKNASPIVGHVREADSNIQLLRFPCGDSKDIVVMNFGAHPTLTGGASKYDISADFVGACRDKMEQELDCNFLYFTAAAGDQNATSRISEENNYDGWKGHGQQLAEYAINGMDALTQVKTGDVQVLEQKVEVRYCYDDGDLLQYCNLVFNAYNSGGAAAANAVGRPLGINSIYHARAINRRATQKERQGESTQVTVNTIAIGDVAFVVAPYEMFSVNGKEIKESSPYEMTFIVTLSNSHNGYLAADSAFDHGCYEVDHRYFVRGTAEQMVKVYLDMLKQMKEG